MQQARVASDTLYSPLSDANRIRSYTARLWSLHVYRVGALAILALLLLCGSGRTESSLEVQTSCRQLAKASGAADAKLTIARNFDNGFCWGAFAALQGLSASRWPDSDKPILGFCAPPESTRIDFIRIFMRYTKAHPEETNTPFAQVALEALASAFPCSEPT